MSPLLIATLASLPLMILALLIWRQHRIRQVYSMPMTQEWQQILENNVVLYRKLPEALRPILHGHIHYFLYSKHFIGKEGLAINDEIRLTIAANACLLVLFPQGKIFPNFTNIIIYPDTYYAEHEERDGLILSRRKHLRFGESWHRGPLVLSWKQALQDSITEGNGHNVILHEFAHKLDSENNIVDGLPILKKRSHYQEWAEVLTREYENFLERHERGGNKVIDSYGALSPAEFFAVITESFFEKSQAMKVSLPELYQQLSRYYLLDPATW